MVKVSVLDIVPVREGATPKDALESTLELAQRAEEAGFHRYWIAEHHNMPGAAGAATGTVAGYVAGGTSRIRIGAGGIMLPNHAPLTVAEQFGTLESIYPSRIDLGLGRAPGADPATAYALRRDSQRAHSFEAEVEELRQFFGSSRPGQNVYAVPGTGLNVPIWILGSSESGARVAAKLGLPFAFASHFAPWSMMDAIAIYRANFVPSSRLASPYVMLGVNVVVADTQAEAERQFTSIQMRYTNIVRGTPGKLPAPIIDINSFWTNHEAEEVSAKLKCSYVGTHDLVHAGLKNMLRKTHADELIVSATLYDQDARLRSHEAIPNIVAAL